MAWKMRSPSLVLNAKDTGVIPYKMDITELVHSHETPASFLGFVAKNAKKQKQKKLASLVINCHGGPACAKIGMWISMINCHVFQQLRNLVEEIWFASCNVAAVKDKRTTKNQSKTDGMYYCKNVAFWTRAHVFASPEMQNQSPTKTPEGHIDKMEKPVYEFFPEWHKEPEKKAWYWSG